MTFNEMFCFLNAGYRGASMAPGEKNGRQEIFGIVHNVLRSHGRAAAVLRDLQADARVGVAHVGPAFVPHTDSEADVEATRRAVFTTPRIDGFEPYGNDWVFEAMINGQYPQYAIDALAEDAPDIQSGDMELIGQGLDFIGVNFYNHHGRVRAQEDGSPEIVKADNIGDPETQAGWDITPEGLYWMPRFYHERYGLPILITENGLASMDWVDLDGKVRDFGRIDYLRRHLRQLDRAIDEGVDVSGYMQWSIMDNFEWGSGYTKRFGIIHVDYRTQKRTLKESAYWYAKVIESNGGNL
jgi:beta-glucosidase